MATLFVSSVDGSDSDNGSSWSLAKASVAGALAIAADGDVIKVDSAHSFAAGGVAITWTPPAGRVAIISVNRAGGDAWLAGATESCGSGTAAFAIQAAAGSSIFMYGMTCQAGTTANAGNDIIFQSTASVSGRIEAWNCTFDIVAASATAQFLFGIGGTSSRAKYGRFVDCTFKTSGSRAGTQFLFTDGNWEFINPTISNTGATKPAVLFGGSGTDDGAIVIIRDGDLSGFNTTAGALFDVATMSRLKVLMENLKLGATPTLTTGTWAANGTGEIMLRNCDSADTLYQFTYVNWLGTLTVDSGASAASGASFNTSGVSWKIVTNSVCNESWPFYPPQLSIWNTALTAMNITIEFAQANGAAALTDREAWIEFDMANSASFPNYSQQTDRNANPFTGSAVDQTTSAVSWSGIAGGTPVTQKAHVNAAPAEVGLLKARLVIAKASTTVWLDPKLRLA